MKIWTDGYDTFENEDEARDDAYTNIDWDDYEEYFYNHVNFHDFFTRVRKNIDPEKFFLEFEMEFCEADEEYFTSHYWEEEQEEEDEE